MRVTSKFLALILATAVQPVIAGTVTLDFEDFSGVTSIGNRYHADKGLKFSPNAWGVRADEDAAPLCNGGFTFVPLAKPGQKNCGALLLGAVQGSTELFSFEISADYGFVEGINFVFATGSNPRALVQALDAQGNVLEEAGLTAPVCDDYDFCNWLPGSLEFAGATSIRFTAGDQLLMLDDIVVRTAGPTQVPEPGSVALALAALGALGWSRKRKVR